MSTTMRDRQNQLDELLDRWESARDRGEILSAEVLCQKQPELLDEVKVAIAALMWVPAVPESADSPSALISFITSDGQGGRVSQEPVPSRLGRYELREPLGAGGFGQVWKAYDLGLRRHVAVKVPRRDRRALPDQINRFLQEARRVAQLRHSGIVPVFDVGRQEAWCYMVSDLIEGESLEGRIRRQPIPWREAARIVAQVAYALHYAHGKGFVHRDVKPANILLDKKGKVYLADFGIAATQKELKSPEQSPSGTLAYMAPEQIEGRPLDGRADIFGLGVVLYEMLTGKRPFQGQNVSELRRAILTAEPVLPAEQAQDIPAEISGACIKALAKQPDLRFSSAREFADTLRSLLQKETKQKRLLVPVVLVIVVIPLIITIRLREKSKVLDERLVTRQEVTQFTDSGPKPILETPTRAADFPPVPITTTVPREVTSPPKPAQAALAPVVDSAPEPRPVVLPPTAVPPPMPPPEEIREVVDPPPKTLPQKSVFLPRPLCVFTFQDVGDRGKNGGLLGQGGKLGIVGSPSFTAPNDADAPPPELGIGVRLEDGKRKESLRADKEWIQGAEWSVSLWFRREKRENVDFLIHQGEWMGMGNARCPQFNVWLEPKGELRLLNYRSFRANDVDLDVTIPGVESGRWYHLAVTFSAPGPATTTPGRLVAYLDGRIVGQDNQVYLGLSARNSKSRLVLGSVYRPQKNTNRTFNGVLASIKFFTTALTAEQVTEAWLEGNRSASMTEAGVSLPAKP